MLSPDIKILFKNRILKEFCSLFLHFLKEKEGVPRQLSANQRAKYDLTYVDAKRAFNQYDEFRFLKWIRGISNDEKQEASLIVFLELCLEYQSLVQSSELWHNLLDSQRKIRLLRYLIEHHFLDFIATFVRQYYIYVKDSRSTDDQIEKLIYFLVDVWNYFFHHFGSAGFDYVRIIFHLILNKLSLMDFSICL